MKIRRSEILLLVQAAAIVLPVAALSAIALYFLHEDKAAIEREARERLQAQMPEMARYFVRSVRGLVEEGLSARIKDGQPLALSDYQRQPEPGAAAVEAVARLQRLEIAEPTAGSAGIIRQAVDLAHRYPEAVTESGTPISGLALLLALRQTNGDLAPELSAELRNNLLHFPSFLAPELLRAARQAVAGPVPMQQVAAIERGWRQVEEEREKTRATLRLVAARLVGLRGSAAIRLTDMVPPALALCEPVPDGWKVALSHDLTLVRAAPYTGLTVEIDHERWRLGPDVSAPTVLASTSGLLDIPGGHAFRMSLDLADPELLYAPYRNRQKLTQWLIFFAAATALIGLTSLWVGYRRQVRLSAMKSNFVSSVSHELRAPLAAVRLMAESLESGRVAEDGRRRNYYSLIVQECRRLSALVENVLDVSRIGEGRKSYRFEPVDLAALVRQSVALMEPVAAERQVTIRLADGGDEEIHPDWDGQAVEQSLVNLLDNAIKHSSAGAEVQVAVEREAGKVRLWVEDSGPGIPLREQKHIFELFYRHGSELRRETKGAGIGLSIVQHVAQAHGGRVIVDSVEGRGSRFGLELPVEHRT